jgi:hypothetical protein
VQRRHLSRRPSSAVRNWYSSRTRASSSRVTERPRPGTSSTRRSVSSRLIASRTGVRLVSSSWAIWTSRSRWPGR